VGEARELWKVAKSRAAQTGVQGRAHAAPGAMDAQSGDELVTFAAAGSKVVLNSRGAQQSLCVQFGRNGRCEAGLRRGVRRNERIVVHMVFDRFLNKKSKDEQGDNVKKENAKPARGLFGGTGSIIDFVRERAQRDIQQVRAFNDGLAKSREKLARDLAKVLGAGKDLETLFEQLEEVLITSDLGIDTVDAVLEDLRKSSRTMKLDSDAAIRSCLKQSLVRILEQNAGPDGEMLELGAAVKGQPGPLVIMVIGANGMGKTTSIGKLATRFKKQGKKVLLAACDTYRAAAVDQLAAWAERAEVDLVRPQENQKAPAGVAFDATKRACKEQFDVLIIDTSGRLHNNVNLMNELVKMRNVVAKARDDPQGRGTDEILLVVDASIGRNAVAQAKAWQRDVGVSGLIVTKLDGTARAGFVVSVVDELKIPIKLVGVGERLEDLRDFDAPAFVEGLVG